MILCRVPFVKNVALLFCLIVLEGCFSIQQNEIQDGQSQSAPSRRKLRSLGLLEGRNEETIIISAPRAAKAGEEEGAFSGRNRKKLKHRRINAFEVTKKRLEERGFMTPSGNLDVKGLTTLMETEDTREGANPQGVAPLKHYLLEDLDRMYPTPEGNARLGLEDGENQATLRNFSKPNRWERKSQFVEFRKPGKLAQILPDEVLNYAKDGGKITIFVQGSAGYRYGIECLEYDTIGHLKQLVWEEERHHRYEVEKMEARDEVEKFEIETQELILNGSMLYPDSRTLKWYNITNYAILYLVPKPEGIVLDEEAKKFTMDLLWWRELHRCWADQSDSDEKDEDYRALKEVYLEACEESYQEFVSHVEGLSTIHEDCLQRCPNLGLLPHPELVDDQKLQQFKEQLEVFCSEDALNQMRAEVTEEVEEVNRATQASPTSAQQSCSRAGGRHKDGPPLVTMRATEEAVEEFLGQITELASWNTANGCPVPNMLPGYPSSSSAKNDRMPSEHARSNAESPAVLRPSLAHASQMKTESDSELVNSLALQKSKSEASNVESLCRKEKGENMDSDATIAKHMTSRTINQGKDQLRGMRVGEKNRVQEQIDSDEEKSNEASNEADRYSKHDDDQSSGSNRREGFSESGAADYALTMAAAEASYSTFDIPKELLREVAQADAELRGQKKTRHEESQARYQKRAGAVGDGKDEGEQDEIRPIVFD